MYSATGHSAGEESSSTYEGRHLTFEESLLTHPVHTDGFVDKGDPVNVGDIVGVAFTGADAATDQVAIDTEGVWFLNVVASDDTGTSAVALGDQLYINTGVISKRASGIPFGKAMSLLTGSASAAVAAVKVHCEMRDIDTSIIVVSTKGNDTTGNGSWGAPLKTLTAALALASTTRKTIYMLPGDYAEAAAITWPNVNGIQVIGLDDCGNVVISEATAATAVVTINPTFTSATFEAFLENVCIEHTAQVGIEIDNANMGNRKLLIHLKGVSTSQTSTGDSINVTHTTAGQAIRIYAEGCDEIEGLIDIVVANADDRFRFKGCVLIGGLTCTGAVAGEVSLLQTIVLTSGLTLDAAQVQTTVGSCYRTDAGVYTQLADAYST
jgi:predicted RecA/RadA family phage recombinase